MHAEVQCLKKLKLARQRAVDRKHKHLPWFWLKLA